MVRALLLAFVVTCAKPPVVTPVVAAPASPGVPLVVLLVVDQLPVRLLDAVADRYDGGLGRLTGEAAYRGVARFSHAATLTCPGHATISTGAAPSVHGIVGNRWLDPTTGAPVYCADPSLLVAEALADKVVDNGGLVASIALKDRSAVMLGGHRPTLAAWYDPATRAFTDDRLAGLDVDRWLARPWTALEPGLYAELVGPDEGALEADPGIGITFPHPAIPDAPQLLGFTPFAGEVLVDAAMQAQVGLGLGADAVPDLLTIGLSEVDYIGHAYTSESWEALDDMLRLDQTIGRLLAYLDQVVGPERYTVLLTSDHGSVRPTGPRVPLDEVQQGATAALRRAGGEGEVLFENPWLYLPAAARDDAELAARASSLVAEDLSAIEGLYATYAVGTGEITGDVADAVRDSVYPGRSGDLYAVLAPGALFLYGSAKGTGHGTPWDDDARVPFLAAGAGIAPARGEVDHDVRQIAVTAAALLGVDPPSGAALGPIGEALAAER